MRHTLPVLLALGFAGVALSAQTGFTTQTFSTPYPFHNQLLTADFNHDGKPDLLSFGSIYGEASPGGAIFMNNGSGGFVAPVLLPGSSGYLALARIGDMNGDGVPDIVGCVRTLSGLTSSDALVVYLNNGSGTFTAAQQIPMTNPCSDLVLGDVNHDSHLDVIVATEVTNTATSAVNNILSTYFGSAAGTIGTPVVQQNISLDDPADPSGIFVNCPLRNITGANFYQDGQVSLILNAYCYFDAVDSGTTTVAHGDGTGHFVLGTVAPHIGFQSGGDVADVNGDGRLDAVFTGDAQSHGTEFISYQENKGGGIFTEHDLGFSIAPNGNTVEAFVGVAVADYNHDGFNDIATSIYTDSLPAISILGGSAGQTFPEAQNWQIGADDVGSVVSADFNGDGRPDLAVLALSQTNSTANLYLYTNNPSANSCGVPSNIDTSVICTPGAGSTVSSPVTVSAASDVPSDFTLNRLYLDGQPVFQSSAQSINTSITAAAGAHKLVMVSYTGEGTAYTSTSNFVVSTSSAPGCLPSSAGVSICAPVAGSTDASPVTLTAGALSASSNITAIRAYIDNVAVLTVANPASTKSFQISQAVSVAAGNHTLVIVAYQTAGAALTQSRTFSVGSSGPCYPAAAGVKICSPAANVQTASPVTVVAGATASSGHITAIRIYVDGVAKALVQNPQTSTSFAVKQGVSVASGTHNLVIVGYESTGGSVTTSETIKIQ